MVTRMVVATGSSQGQMVVDGVKVVMGQEAVAAEAGAGDAKWGVT